MTHDQTDQNAMSSPTPPDQGSAGDVSTTGHSAHDVQAAGMAGGDQQDAGHGGHGVDTSNVSTLVPTTWKQLILPAIILAIVAILVSGPIFNAFASRPGSTTPPNAQRTTTGGSENGQPSTAGGATPASSPTPAQGGSPAATSTVASLASPTTASLVVPTQQTQSNAQAAPNSTLVPSLAPTQTAVAQAGESGAVARVPVELTFSGATFVIKTGGQLLPDWKPSADVGIATWLEGTVANHILYVPFSSQNEALFKAAKAGDKIRLTMNTGQVFEFAVNRAERAVNGPAEKAGDFTVTAAMAQDHAGVTLFLIGDPAADRAVVQADFTGNIQ